MDEAVANKRKKSNQKKLASQETVTQNLKINPSKKSKPNWYSTIKKRPRKNKKEYKVKKDIKNARSAVKLLHSRQTPGTEGANNQTVENTAGLSLVSDEKIEFTPIRIDSATDGQNAFKWLIKPGSVEQFFSLVWETKPLFIDRGISDYYTQIISIPIIDDMLHKHNIQFDKNIQVLPCDGVERTQEGRAHPHVVWQAYSAGCTVKLFNPQTYIPALHQLIASLQEFFNSSIDAKSYLVPPLSMTGCPQCDDMEAFVLQAAGKRHWRIYKPQNQKQLPRNPSTLYYGNKRDLGKPVMEGTLEPGDIIYIPRGFVYETSDGGHDLHSLHLTIRVNQNHSWADLFEKLVPTALQQAISENVELRKGFPRDIYDHFGAVHSDSNTNRKIEITNMVMTLFDKIKNALHIDNAVDQMHKIYQHAALPPVLKTREKSVTVYTNSDKLMEEGRVNKKVIIRLYTRIRLLRKNILRMVYEEKVRLYYYAGNSLEYHGNKPLYLEIKKTWVHGVETLVSAYPEYVSVNDLDILKSSDQLNFANALFSRGLIMTEYPLAIVDEDSD